MEQTHLLAHNPLLLRSIRNRFPYLDPLNHVQVELSEAAPRARDQREGADRDSAHDQRHLGGAAQQRVSGRHAQDARERAMVRAHAVREMLSYLFHGPAWLTFLAMGAAGGGFAVCTFDLFELFSANFKLIADLRLDGGRRRRPVCSSSS